MYSFDLSIQFIPPTFAIYSNFFKRFSTFPFFEFQMSKIQMGVFRLFL